MMMVAVYVLDGGHWEGQYSLDPWINASQHRFEVTVPDGSMVSKRCGSTVLLTSQGRALSASQIVEYGRVGVVGFDCNIPRAFIG